MKKNLRKVLLAVFLIIVVLLVIYIYSYLPLNIFYKNEEIVDITVIYEGNDITEKINEEELIDALLICKKTMYGEYNPYREETYEVLLFTSDKRSMDFLIGKNGGFYQNIQQKKTKIHNLLNTEELSYVLDKYNQ